MTDLPEQRTATITLTECGPARNLPTGMLIDLLDVFKFHGIEPAPSGLMLALVDMLNKTPVEKGGRLRPDGTVDRD